MMPGRRVVGGGVGLVILFLLGVLVAGAGGAFAQTDEERLAQVQQDMDDLRQQIENARTDQSEYATSIVATQERMDRLTAELAQAEAEQEQAQQRVQEKEREIVALQREIAQIQASLSETRLDLDQTQNQIRSQVAELYMNGSTGWENALFESERASEAVVVLEYGRSVVGEVTVLVRSLETLEQQSQAFQDSLEDENRQELEALSLLENERSQAQEYAQSVQAARDQWRAELIAQESLLAQIQADITHYEGHLDALEQAVREIEQEILRRQIRDNRAPGRLAYPVQGRLSSPFGYRIHPVLGGRRLHAGIDIAAPTGTPIHAAASGLVILAEWWGGYGRAVVLDHGGGLSTLYAHLSAFVAGEGREVVAGDVIGYVGCSGYCTGPHLHFEVREAGKPVDPLTYLN